MIDLNEILEELEPDVMPKGTWLSVYTTSQYYGGPEEGGWWYNATEFEGGKYYPTREEAQKALDRLNVWAEEESKKKQRAVDERLANLPEGPDPYLDTEGYIPRHQQGSEEYRLVLESNPGEQDSSNEPAPTYE